MRGSLQPHYSHPRDSHALYKLFPQFRPEWGFAGQAHWFDLLSKSEYKLFVATAPRTGIDQVASGDSVEHNYVMPVGSLLWGITSSSGLSAGFRFQLWNEGRLVVPRMNAANLAGTAGNTTFSVAGPYLLDPPYPVLGNGLINVRLTNLGTATNGLQLVMFFAVPLGGAS